MIDLYYLENSLRIERELLAKRHAREVAWFGRTPHAVTTTSPVIQVTVAARRYLARTLLSFADSLDPRAVISVPHVPARPALNGRTPGRSLIRRRNRHGTAC